MSDERLDGLLGVGDHDPGCDAGFAVLDRYCEAVRRGEDVAALFPGFVAHIRNCAACREDAEGMLAILDAMEQGGDH